MGVLDIYMLNVLQSKKHINPQFRGTVHYHTKEV